MLEGVFNVERKLIGAAKIAQPHHPASSTAALNDEHFGWGERGGEA